MGFSPVVCLTYLPGADVQGKEPEKIQSSVLNSGDPRAASAPGGHHTHFEPKRVLRCAWDSIHARNRS